MKDQASKAAGPPMPLRRRLQAVRQGLLALASLLAPACGRDWQDVLWGPSREAREARPSPSPSTPPAIPAPTASPSPTPLASAPTPNTAPVARVGARVYFVECQGQVVNGWDAVEAAVGCRLHMDCTPRDAADQPTQARGTPSWYVNDPTLVTGGARSSYTPAFYVSRPGDLRLHVEVDGVESNTVAVRLF